MYSVDFQCENVCNDNADDDYDVLIVKKRFLKYWFRSGTYRRKMKGGFVGEQRNVARCKASALLET